MHLSYKHTSRTTSISSFIKKSLKSLWPYFLLSAFCFVFVGSVSIYRAKIIREIIILSQGKDHHKLGSLIFYYSIVLGVESILWVVFHFFFRKKLVPKLRYQTISKYVDKTLGKSYLFHQKNHSGILSNHLTNLTDNLPLILEGILKWLLVFCNLSFSCYALAPIGGVYVLLFLSMAVGIFAIVAMFNKKFSLQSSLYTKQKATISSEIVDIFSNILSIKLFSRESLAQEEHQESISKLYLRESSLAKTTIKRSTAIGVLQLLINIGNLAFLLYGTIYGNITIGDFVVVLTINEYLRKNISWNIPLFNDFSRYIEETKVALKVLEAPQRKEDVPSAHPLCVGNGEIKFENVTFNYGVVKTPVWENFSLTIPEGQSIGIVGASGEGKSTLIQLLLRLYKVDSGKILINGININDVTQKSLFKQIGVLTQEVSLTNNSIIDNIEFGKSGATKDEIFNAARKAYAHDFIISKPDGYNTNVGSASGMISGGEAQRVAIARVILKNAPILLMDEATAQLDAISEKQVMNATMNLISGKTAIIIAHKLSTLLRLDRIIVVEGGKIIEDGNHKTLLAKKGRYEELWEKQHETSLG